MYINGEWFVHTLVLVYKRSRVDALVSVAVHMSNSLILEDFPNPWHTNHVVP